MKFQNSLLVRFVLLFLLFLIILLCNSAPSGSRRKGGRGRGVEKYGEGSERKVEDSGRTSRRGSGHREKSGQRKKDERRNEEEDLQKDNEDKYKYNRDGDEGTSRRDEDRRPSGNRKTSRSWPVSAEERRKSHGVAYNREGRRKSDGRQSDVYEYGRRSSRTGRRRRSSSVGREGRRSGSRGGRMSEGRDGRKSGSRYGRRSGSGVGRRSQSGDGCRRRSSHDREEGHDGEGRGRGERRRHSSGNRERRREGSSSRRNRSQSRKHKSITTSAGGGSKTEIHKSRASSYKDEKTIQKEAASEKMASSGSGSSSTTSNVNIKELFSVKDDNHIWRVKDYHGSLRVLTNDTTGNDIFHSMVEINGKNVNKKMLKMPYEISIATQLLANMNKTNKRKILNIGLGGGEMANFLHELDPSMEITSVEISKSIIKIARKYFGYMEGQKNESVLNEDGIEYIKRVAQEESNILGAILVDACNATAESILTCPVNEFITEEMAQKMHVLLKDGGVLVMNIYADKSVNPEDVKRELLKLQTIFRAHFKSCYFVKIENNENMTFTCVKNSQQTKSKSFTVKSQREYEKMVAGIKIPAASRWAKNVLNKIKTQLMVIE